jgi:hypothetical protein
MSEEMSRLHSVSGNDDVAATHNFKCFVGTCGHRVWAAVGWLEGTADSVLPQEDVGGIREVLVDKGSRGCMTSCWDGSQLGHVVAKLLYEGGCFDPLGNCYQQFFKEVERFSVNEFCCGCLQVFFVGSTYAKEDEWERVCPLVICVTHDGSFHGSMQAFHKIVGSRVMRGCSAEVNATNLCKVVEELGFELASLVGGDGLWATKTGNPSREQSAGYCFCCDV